MTTTPPTDQQPVRKGLLPCTPPAEWEFHTVSGARSDTEGVALFPGDTGPVVIRRLVSYGDWEPVRPERWADEPATDAHATGAAAPAAVPPTPRPAAPTDWIDGHPQLEAIAAAVYERCETGDGGVVHDDPRNVAVAALSALASALPPPADRAAEAEAPLSPDYEHPECGFHWHGRDGMDIPMRAGEPVCPRCELRKVEKQLRHSEKLREELRVESRRRGKVKLEYAEKIRLLEIQLDEVRSQLGAEILRAGQAEAELRRLADEAQQPEAPWATDGARIGRVLIWSWARVGDTDFGQGYRTAQEDVRAILTRPLLGAEGQPETEPGADLIEDYLRFLRGQGPEPDLSDLASEQREAIAGQFEIVRALADRDPSLPLLDCDPVARRMGLNQPADEAQQQPETQARPAAHEWFIETRMLDGRWSKYGAPRDTAADGRELFERDTTGSGKVHAFRLVHATTTYAIEAEHQPAAASAGVQTDEEA